MLEGRAAGPNPPSELNNVLACCGCRWMSGLGLRAIPDRSLRSRPAIVFGVHWSLITVVWCHSGRMYGCRVRAFLFESKLKCRSGCLKRGGTWCQGNARSHKIMYSGLIPGRTHLERTHPTKMTIRLPQITPHPVVAQWSFGWHAGWLVAI